VNAHSSLSTSADGGLHWDRIWTAPEIPGTIRTVLSACLLPGTDGYALIWDESSGTTLQRTPDGGTTWATTQRWPLVPGGSVAPLIGGI